MAKYPVYLDLAGKRAVVIGAGPLAITKVRSLIDAEAQITVIAKKIYPHFKKFFKGIPLDIRQQSYKKECIERAALVIAATNDQDLNQQIFDDCKSLKILCNVVDIPDLCDFHVPATVRRGDLQIAISTNGKCPAYAAQLRRKFQELITHDHASFLEALEYIRQRVITDPDLTPDKRIYLLRELASDKSFARFQNEDPQAWKHWAKQLVEA